MLQQEEINNRSASMALANMILSVADDNIARGIKTIADTFSGTQAELDGAVRRFTEDNAEIDMAISEGSLVRIIRAPFFT